MIAATIQSSLHSLARARCSHIALRGFSRCATSKHSDHDLPAGRVRTRFAPSPTGKMHLGSLRTALFNYLLAKRTRGNFILRIEDTDQKRTIDGADMDITMELDWHGITPDEGPFLGDYGPYYQSQRIELYRKYAAELLLTPKAYRCFCSSERLDELARRRAALGLPTDYDRMCASLSHAESEERAHNGEPFVIRLRAPDFYPSFTDMVYGQVGRSHLGNNAGVIHKHGEIAYEDPILMKSDGMPTYHLANVIDDHHMEISHVVRGTEWLSSTPKHLALYDAFGWDPPKFAHVGLLVDEQGRKLSKRNMDTSLESFRERGVLPEALVNFAVLLGWSHSSHSDVMDLEEMISIFEPKFTRGDSKVTFGKLNFLQRAHAERVFQDRGDSFRTLMHQMYEVAVVLFSEIEMRSLLRKSLPQMTQSTIRSLAINNVDPYATQLSPAKRPIMAQVCLLLNADGKNFTSQREFLHRNRYFFCTPPLPSESAVFLNDSRSHQENPVSPTQTSPPKPSNTTLTLPSLLTLSGYLLSPVIYPSIPPTPAHILLTIKRLAIAASLQDPSTWTWTLAPPLPKPNTKIPKNTFQEARQDTFIAWPMPTEPAAIAALNSSSFPTNWRFDPALAHLANTSQPCEAALRPPPEDAPQPTLPSVTFSTPAQKNLYAQLCHHFRAFLLDGADGPGIGATIYILGRRNCVQRWRAWRDAVFPREHPALAGRAREKPDRGYWLKVRPEQEGKREEDGWGEEDDEY